MVQVGREAWGHRESDPARAQALYEEGLRMAQQLAEPWWAMYYTQRRIQARMFWCDHFDDALGWAVESALEARKPQYASFPLLFSVYFKLVFGYACVDPAGYAAEIRQALNSLEQDVPRFNLEDHFLLEFAKRQFALGLDDMEGVEQSAALAPPGRGPRGGPIRRLSPGVRLRGPLRRQLPTRRLGGAGGKRRARGGKEPRRRRTASPVRMPALASAAGACGRARRAGRGPGAGWRSLR